MMAGIMSTDAREHARQLIRDGDLHGAARMLSGYLESAPGDAAAHAQLAVLVLELGDAERAVQSFRQALDHEPGNAGFHNDLGTALEAAGRESEAADAYRRAAESRPPLPPAQYNLALILGRRGQWHEAAELLRGALQEAPQFRAARQQLGFVLRQLGDDPAAGECFDALVATDADDVAARRAIAEMHMDHCRYADAADQLQRCLDIAPDDAAAALALGACLQELGRVDEALEQYRRLLRRDRRHYYDVVKKLTGSSKGCFWVDAEELRRVLLG
jgi:Flp pilus assembly protein TadD